MLQTLSTLLFLCFPSNSPFTIGHGNSNVGVLQDLLSSEKEGSSSAAESIQFISSECEFNHKS